jgi:hypothetical protein
MYLRREHTASDETGDRVADFSASSTHTESTGTRTPTSARARNPAERQKHKTQSYRLNSKHCSPHARDDDLEHGPAVETQQVDLVDDHQADLQANWNESPQTANRKRTSSKKKVRPWAQGEHQVQCTNTRMNNNGAQAAAPSKTRSKS